MSRSAEPVLTEPEEEMPLTAAPGRPNYADLALGANQRVPFCYFSTLMGAH